MKLEARIIQELKRQKKKVSIAESCTGGLIAARLTSVPGASDVFEFGVVSYGASAKKKILKVPIHLIKQKGEVSTEVAFSMAKGIQRLSRSDYAMGITGIAGPTGGTPKKPVGTVCFSLLSPKRSHIKKIILRGTRHHIQTKAASLLLKQLYKDLKEN